MNVKFSAKCVAVIAAGAMSMSLAACSGGSMDGSSSSNGSAANGDTITLGSITTNSGTAAAYGEAEVAGFKLAVDEINAKGGKGGIAGDAKFDEVEPIVEAITPVPGGVGSVTTSVLMKHVVEAAERG